MLIDWFTVGFQIVNFLILIVLLKRFLYGPIIRAMDEREKKIATRLSEAADAKKEAEEKALLLARDQEEFAQARSGLEDGARQEIKKWKEESIKRIRSEIEEQRAAWQQSLVADQETFLRKLKIHISQQVFLVAAKAMADLADAQLEERLVDSFLKKIKEEPGISVEGNNHSATTLELTTGFPLDPGRREILRDQLSSSFPSFNGVDFKEDDLGFGIRLLAGDRKWEWNLARYMRDIEKEILLGMSMTNRKVQ